MKIIKKTAELLLCVALVFSLSVEAFASTDLSDADKNLTPAQQAAITAAKEAYENATTYAERNAAHAAAEAVRNSAGYSGGADGDGTGPASSNSDTSTRNSNTSSGNVYNSEAPYTDHTAADERAVAGLTAEDTLTIATLADLYERSGDNPTLQAMAHAVAEALRGEYGYSGGGDGNLYIADSGSGSSSGGSSITVADKTYYTIAASASTGGNIDPAGTIAVAESTSKTYTITAGNGYKISSVCVDGSSMGAVSTYTFSNITSAHTISVSFESIATLSAGNVVIGDNGDGYVKNMPNGNYQTKSGYGITASLSVSGSYVSDTSVSATYKFTTAAGTKTVSLQQAGGSWQFPVNFASLTGARKIYIPVETKDGTYTITFTVRALDPQATALTGSNVYLTATESVTITVKGSMYEDDFTGNS